MPSDFIPNPETLRHHIPRSHMNYTAANIKAGVKIRCIDTGTVKCIADSKIENADKVFSEEGMLITGLPKTNATIGELYYSCISVGFDISNYDTVDSDTVIDPSSPCTGITDVQAMSLDYEIIYNGDPTDGEFKPFNPGEILLAYVEKGTNKLRVARTSGVNGYSSKHIWQPTAFRQPGTYGVSQMRAFWYEPGHSSLYKDVWELCENSVFLGFIFQIRYMGITKEANANTSIRISNLRYHHLKKETMWDMPQNEDNLSLDVTGLSPEGDRIVMPGRQNTLSNTNNGIIEI